LIDPTGRVRERLGYSGVGFIEGTLPAQTQITLATRLCRIWLPFYAGLLLAILIALYLKSGRAPHARAL
jgi:apolipoprotein N-acyltransferase